MKFLSGVILVIMVLLTGCSNFLVNPAEDFASIQTPTSLKTPSPSETVTASPTETLAPTNTPIPIFSINGVSFPVSNEPISDKTIDRVGPIAKLGYGVILDLTYSLDDRYR